MQMAWVCKTVALPAAIATGSALAYLILLPFTYLLVKI